VEAAHQERFQFRRENSPAPKGTPFIAMKNVKTQKDKNKKPLARECAPWTSSLLTEPLAFEKRTVTECTV
jgi:hypothetical protein